VRDPEGRGSGESAWQGGLRRLARRDHTEAEIRKALLKSHPEAEVEEAVRRLRQAGYLDDAGFAARFARSRLAHQGQGRYRIRQALRAKGVSGAPAEKGLEAALSEVSETAALEAVARRYWRQRPGEDPRLRMRRVWAALVRRGFPAGLVSERIAALWPRWKGAVVGLEAPETDETALEG
jgi:regulatory protein